MTEIHILDIQLIEQNTQTGLQFKYKPDVPKLKLVGTILISAEEEEVESCVFLTQKQLHLITINKDIEFKIIDDTWSLAKPLNREQLKSIGLINIESEFLGNTEEGMPCYEVLKVTA